MLIASFFLCLAYESGAQQTQIYYVTPPSDGTSVSCSQQYQSQTSQTLTVVTTCPDTNVQGSYNVYTTDSQGSVFPALGTGGNGNGNFVFTNVFTNVKLGDLWQTCISGTPQVQCTVVYQWN